MIVQMDKMIAPSRERAQCLYDKNIELENRRRRSSQARVPSDPNAWQQMRENYEAIILEDYDFSEQHSIEYALWQLHYRRIEEFRAHFSSALAPLSSTPSQGGKGPTRPDRITKIRLQFKTFLSEATGFYHDLILKIRAKYGLPLGSFSEESDNRMLVEKDGKKFAEMKKGLISCHRCLIYLGDLARYRGLYGEGDSKNRDYAAASSYYLQAASLWPSSGNPHHQLAILASYSSDELVAIYRYFRSLAVDSPFSTARDNLIVAFEKNRHSFGQLLGDVKVSAPRESCVRMTAKGRGKGEAKLQSKDTSVETGLVQGVASGIHESFKTFCIRFVRLNGILFTRTSLETFAEVLSSVCSALNELLSSGSEEDLNFGVDAVENGLMIVRLISILIFAVYNVNRQSEGQTYAEILQRNVLLQNAFTAVFEFMGHIMKRCTQLHNPSSSYLLPGILVFVEWLAACPDVAVGTDMDEKQAAVRSMFWNNYVLFLNQLLSDGSVSMDDEEDQTCFFNMSKYEEGETENRLALWEDFELRGFLPLLPAQTILDFSRKHSSGSEGTKEKKTRVRRVLAAGKALANVVRVDEKTVYFDSKVKKFVVGTEPHMSGDSIFNPYLGMPLSKGVMQETLAVRAKSPGALQANVPLHVEGEEEDEVIVFKPTMSEKHSDVIDPNWSAYNGLEPVKNASAGDLQFYDGAVSAPLSDFYEHAGLSVGLQPPLSVADIVPFPQHQLPVQSCASSWFVEQEHSLANGLKYLNVLENQLPRKPDTQDMGISHSAAFPLPIQQSFNYNGSGLSYSQTGVLEAVIPSKIDTIIYSRAETESSVALPAFPAGSRKSPVCRPARHLGPPPGFSSVSPKHVNEPLSGSDLRSENPLMDDYSWLDGYQLPPSVKRTGINNSMNHAFDGNSQLVSKSNGVTGPISFPFPGKQVSAMQFHVDKPKAWQDYQSLEHLDLQHERQLHQQQQLMKGNQQLVSLPEQYQGQSFWTGHYFV